MRRRRRGNRRGVFRCHGALAIAVLSTAQGFWFVGA
jgi:hypothetical protein